MLKSNAVVSEWLCSPIRYLPDHPVVGRLSALADELFNPRALGHHYASVGRTAAERWLDGADPVPVKTYFYALRPALAIRALRLNPARRPAMNLQALMVDSNIPSALTAMIEELVEAKRQTRERGNARRYPALDALIRDELGRAAELPNRQITANALAHANEIFLDLVTT